MRPVRAIQILNASKYDFNCYTNGMFQFFPKGRQGWLRALFFPFQAYAVVALVVTIYYHRTDGDVARFGALFFSGLNVCFLALLVIGIGQMISGHRLSGLINLCLAAL